MKITASHFYRIHFFTSNYSNLAVSVLKKTQTIIDTFSRTWGVLLKNWRSDSRGVKQFWFGEFDWSKSLKQCKGVKQSLTHFMWNMRRSIKNWSSVKQCWFGKFDWSKSLKQRNGVKQCWLVEFGWSKYLK